MKNRIELHAKTKYSIDHESTIDIKELILKCASNGEKGVAIVDKDSVLGFLKAEKILKELNIKNFKLVYGIEVNVFIEKLTYKAVILLKKRNGLSTLYRMLSPYFTNNKLLLEDLMLSKKNFIIGLIYEQDNYNSNILQYFNYVEVDDKVSEEVIANLKRKTLVVYSNRINALSKDEELSKKVLYNKLHIKEKIDTRIYKSTQEILKQVKDMEIVIDNPNKIFNMIENFNLLENNIYLPVDDNSYIDLLVNTKLNEKYNNDIPLKVKKRIDEELKLIKEHNYEGFINLYKKIIDKCKEEQEEYVICDYINYLYIAYLLGITHFDPIKHNLNYELFFINHPKITIKISPEFVKKLNIFIKEELNVNMIRCKGLMRLNSSNVKNIISDYKKKYNIKISTPDKLLINKYLMNYPINNWALTPKNFILPVGVNIFDLSPRELIKEDDSYHRVTNIDYKDIEENFITLELISTDKLMHLMELKDITKDKIINCNYKDSNIIKNEAFQDYLEAYQKDILLDDLYEDCLNSKIDLIEIFNIINEIKHEKNISNKTKKILTKNNIVINDKNANFICRGILNERTRLEYELLYFKKYYPLEYYYVLLKDCPFNDIIDIIKNGYEEVKNRIKDYSKYRYEYKYLKLVAKLYESNINFSIEEREIVEDYCFELDKENKKIILITNKTNNEIYKYLSNNLSIIGTRPINGKMPYMSKIIAKLIRINKDVILFGLDGKTNFYLEYLLSEITRIDRKAIRQYLNPCSCYKDSILTIDEERYINGIRYLLYHNLTIKDYHNVKDIIIDDANMMIDKLIYMIEESESKVIIIDRVESIEGNISNTLERIKEIAKLKKLNVILFTNLKKEYEESNKKDISSFENNELLDKYVDYINILDDKELYHIKEK